MARKYIPPERRPTPEPRQRLLIRDLNHGPEPDPPNMDRYDDEQYTHTLENEDQDADPQRWYDEEEEEGDEEERDNDDHARDEQGEHQARFSAAVSIFDSRGWIVEEEWEENHATTDERESWSNEADKQDLEARESRRTLTGGCATGQVDEKLGLLCQLSADRIVSSCFHDKVSIGMFFLTCTARRS
jgi:hypothetical protein